MATFYIKHITKYTYSKDVIDGATLIRLHPINDEFQKVNSHFLTITNNTFVETFTDFYNNRVGTFMITEPHSELVIESDVEVITFDRIFPDDSVDTPSQWLALKKLKQDINFIDFLQHRPFSGSQDVLKLIESKNLKSKSPYKAVLELCEYIYQNFKYHKGITNVDSSIEEVWKLKAGVCQDFTVLLLQMVRMLGIPARYVSGYICPNDAITRGEGATHAWIEAYIPFYGWLGIDPTNNAIANENHVRLAIGRNYNDCSPAKGVFKGKVEAELHVKVHVSTSKNMVNSTTQTDNFIPLETDNSFQQNLERIQQQQMQQ
ncbi:transglutaminase family protein [Algibacter luteus]|uniref:transglutaminase family protein n=1 Tax=Algibacter luteus TaxID=1178825 RepID=UPI0025983138|nr:transglutaminase family protein [Algibacter luteus]WJJ96628.1 transglutaminase family protein [Algibacter luteus]